MQGSAIPTLQIMGSIGGIKDALVLAHQNSSKRQVKTKPSQRNNKVFAEVCCHAQQLAAL
jgi:hypothetical protein